MVKRYDSGWYRRQKPKRVWTKQMKEHRQDLARMLRLTLMERWDSRCRWFIGAWKGPVMGPIRGGLDSGMCQADDKDVLQFAHVHGKETELKGSSRGQYYRLKDVFDHPDCYVLLCKDHHLEYDKSK